MISYLTISILWGMGFEYLQQQLNIENDRLLTLSEKVLNVLLWPLMLTLFLKEFLNNK